MNRFVLMSAFVAIVAIGLAQDAATHGQGTETQTFDSEASANAAGWVANDEAQSPLRNIDLGWKDSNQAGGAAPGEGGGLIHRSGQLPIAFYADTSIGSFTFDDPLSASGKIRLINDDYDGELHLGFFDVQRILDDPTDYGAELGFTVAEPNGDSAPNFRWGYTMWDDDRNGGTPFNAWQEPGAEGIPDDTSLDFLIEYDPGDGDGALTLTIGDEPPFTAFLDAGQRAAGGTFNGFGLYSGPQPNTDDDRSLELFIDDVTYTSAEGGGGAVLRPGDADMDLDFDQIDLVQVQIAAKYLTGQPATWGEGDWNGAPGGSPGNPPPGNSLFDQLDIIAALGADIYLKGPYAAIQPGGDDKDERTSIVYNAGTGEVGVNAPASTELTSVNIDSASGIFVNHATAQHLDGSFDNHAESNIFKATFGSSFGSLNFGVIAQAGLSEQFVANDLTVVGSLLGGGGLGDVDLIYVPEPTTAVLLVLGLFMMAGQTWRRRRS